MYASYKDHVQLLIVYIREAHPNLLKEGNETGIVGVPKDLQERTILATQCVSQYKLTLPMVLDGMDGKVNRDYQAAPVRVTVVDIDGKVAFYAGRGPGDFRIPPVERTLKKLVANQGRMPPKPAPQWGEPVDGLQCGLCIDPQDLMIREGVVIRVVFRNTAEVPLAMNFDPADIAAGMAIRNADGRVLRVKPVAGVRRGQNRRAARAAGSGSVQAIEPGRVLEAEIESAIVPARGVVVSGAGPFEAVYQFQVRDTTPPTDAPTSAQIWTGSIQSGICSLHVELPAIRRDQSSEQQKPMRRVREADPPPGRK